MPELDKEAIEFLTRFFGGTVSALTQNAFDYYYSANPAARNQFPFTRPEQHLPMWSNIIVGGISIGEVLLALGIEEDPLKLMERMDYRAKEKLKEFAGGLRKFGEGGTLYSVPMLTHRTIMINIPAPVGSPAPTGREQPVLQGRVIKL